MHFYAIVLIFPAFNKNQISDNMTAFINSKDFAHFLSEYWDLMCAICEDSCCLIIYN